MGPKFVLNVVVEGLEEAKVDLLLALITSTAEILGGTVSGGFSEDEKLDDIGKDVED